MPRISKQKRDKISEHILSVLLDNFPKPMFNSHIAREIARDEEFTKLLLEEMTKKKLIIPVDRNQQGTKYQKRVRWRVSNKIHEVYYK